MIGDDLVKRCTSAVGADGQKRTASPLAMAEMMIVIDTEINDVDVAVGASTSAPLFALLVGLHANCKLSYATSPS